MEAEQFDVKVDYIATDKDHIFVRYSHGEQDQPTTNTFPLIFDRQSTAPFKAAVLNWTRTLSPNMVNETRVGFNRVVLDTGGVDKGLGNIAEDLGISNGNERGPGLLSIQFDGGLASNIGSNNIGRWPQGGCCLTGPPARASFLGGDLWVDSVSRRAGEIPAFARRPGGPKLP